MFLKKRLVQSACTETLSIALCLESEAGTNFLNTLNQKVDFALDSWLEREDQGSEKRRPGKGRGWGITLGRRSEGVQGAAVDLVWTCIFLCSVWAEVEGERGTAPCQEMFWTPHLICSHPPMGSGRFLLLWAHLTAIPCFHTRAGGPVSPKEMRPLFLSLCVITPFVPGVNLGPCLYPCINQFWEKGQNCLKPLQFKALQTRNVELSVWLGWQMLLAHNQLPVN